MEYKFDFNGLFVLDMANNHQGDVEHGINIIKEMAAVTKKAGVRGALKFQFRQLDTFIHPEFKQKKDIKHIPRFVETALSKEQYALLTKCVQENDLVTICTPFDEESVDIILELGIEVIKIASCSADDWPLLEKIANTNRPVIVSTAGLSLTKIDRLVSFFEIKRVHFAVMHCVAIYPTPLEKMNLNQVQLLSNRYPNIPIGFSTHEDPDNQSAVQVAYAKGAKLFERHVGLETQKHKLNAYSSGPDQIGCWIDAYKEAVQLCGGEERSPASPAETASLKSLMRGVYAKKKLAKGSKLSREDIFFSMPLQDGQLTSGNWNSDQVADTDYEPNEPVSEAFLSNDLSKEDRVFRILLQVKGMLNQARIYIGKDSSLEISHHYGLERFREFGAVIVNCINRAYCKKLIILLPRQKHPYHFHKVKEETFQLLYGDMEVELNGKKQELKPGDTFLVKPEEWHKFHSLGGAVFEEVSTTHLNDDSFYEDERIAKLDRDQRKTAIHNWEDVERKSAVN